MAPDAELQLIERNPGLLNEPRKVLLNFARLAYQGEHSQMSRRVASCVRRI